MYKQKSAEVKAVLEQYDPYLKMYSLDEAYMDIGPYLDLSLKNGGSMSHEDINNALFLARECSEENGDDPTASLLLDSEKYHAAARDLLHSIRQKVKDTTGLTCSAGLASNFLIAKGTSVMNQSK